MTTLAEQAPLRRLARTSVLSLSGSMTAAAVGFALAMVLTRSLDAADAGAVFTTTTLVSLLVASCLLGADTGLARFLLRAESTGPHAVRDLLRAALVPPLLVAAAVAFTVLFWRDPLGSLLLPDVEGGPRLLQVAALVLPVAVVGELALSATRAWGLFRPTVWIDRLARPSLQLAAVVLVLHLGWGTTAVLVVWAGAFAIGTTAACRSLSRALRHPSWLQPVPVPHDHDRRVPARTFWRFTGPRGVAGLAQAAVQRVDVVLVAVVLSPAHAAVYVVATRFVAVGQLANAAVHQVLQPQFTALLMARDRAGLSRVHGTATAWSVLLVWPLYLVVLCSPLTYLALFGSATSPYAEGVPVVVVMAGAMLLAVASGPVDTLLLMAGHSGLSMVNALGALVIDVLLCLALLPRWGLVGAAVAWAVAVAVRSGLGLLQVGLLVRVLPDLRLVGLAALAPITCFLVPGLGWRAVGGTGTAGWLLVLVAGAVGYVLLLHRLRGPLGLDLLAAAVLRRPHASTPPATAAPPCAARPDPDAAAPCGTTHER